MIAKKHIRRSITAILLFIAFPIVNATESSNDAPARVTALKELRREHDGKEVTMTFKMTGTQLIGGDRDGQFPHVKLHYEGMREEPYLVVYAKGDVADLLHRCAYVAPDDTFIGRSIKATGKIKVYRDFPEGVCPQPVYILDLTDWKKFQVLPETKGD